MSFFVSGLILNSFIELEVPVGGKKISPYIESTGWRYQRDVRCIASWLQSVATGWWASKTFYFVTNRRPSFVWERLLLSWLNITNAKFKVTLLLNHIKSYLKLEKAQISTMKLLARVEWEKKLRQTISILFLYYLWNLYTFYNVQKKWRLSKDTLYVRKHCGRREVTAESAIARFINSKFKFKVF